eukprot:Hpha_TRINITY_DN16610_c2_g3::TRINITY_DN16610_c2_g3_i15::g.179948::m.179948
MKARALWFILLILFPVDSQRARPVEAQQPESAADAMSLPKLVSRFYPYPHRTAPRGSPGWNETFTDLRYPGSAVARHAAALKNVHDMVVADHTWLSEPEKPELELEKDPERAHLARKLRFLLSPSTSMGPDKLWQSEIRPRLLQLGGLSVTRDTSHAFNDDNHCDLTVMQPFVQDQRNAGGEIRAISRKNFLGDHIRRASVSLLDGEKQAGAASAVTANTEGGSWSTCTNGADQNPPRDVAHVQFQARVAFKLVWVPRGSAPGWNRFVLVDDEGRFLALGRPADDASGLPHVSWRQGNFALVAGGQYAVAAERVAKLADVVGLGNDDGSGKSGLRTKLQTTADWARLVDDLGKESREMLEAVEVSPIFGAFARGMPGDGAFGGIHAATGEPIFEAQECTSQQCT